MEAYTSTYGLITHWLIFSHNALVTHLKLVPEFRTCFLFPLPTFWLPPGLSVPEYLMRSAPWKRPSWCWRVCTWVPKEKCSLEKALLMLKGRYLSSLGEVCPGTGPVDVEGSVPEFLRRSVPWKRPCWCWRVGTWVPHDKCALEKALLMLKHVVVAHLVHP